jgi:hypothetical protein
MQNNEAIIRSKTDSSLRERRPTGFHFVTPVWGHVYTQLYLDVVIPAQLARGNLPVFRNQPGMKYVIYTKPGDAETILSSTAFELLSEVINVVIELIDDDTKVPHDAMSKCFQRGIAVADKVDAAVVLLTPDLILANGAFAKLKALSDLGHDTIFISGIRTLKQRLSARLRDKYLQDGVICIEPRDLMRLALDNLHPITQSSFWEEGPGDLVPSNLFWRAGNEGLVGRCFHLHPLLVYPQRKGAVFFRTVDDDFYSAACPDDSCDYVVNDSDELLAVELSDMGRVFKTGFTKGSIREISEWAEQCTSQRHRKLFQHTLRLHVGIRNSNVWARATDHATKTATAIERRLRRSSIELLLTDRRALFRRMIRQGEDKRLSTVNGLPCPSHLDPLLVSKLNQAAHVIMTHYIAAMLSFNRWYQKLSRAIFGNPHRPKIWSLQYHYLARTRRSISDMFADHGSSSILFIDQQNPAASTILDKSGSRMERGLFVTDGDAIKLASASDGNYLAASSQEAIFIDRAFPQKGDIIAVIQEIRRVLRPGGRVVIVAQYARLRDGRGEYVQTFSAEEIAKAFDDGFLIRAQRRTGGIISICILLVRNFFRTRLAAFRIPAFISLPVHVIAIPLRMILAMILNPLIYAMDLFDRPHHRAYISSITLAIKT